MSFFDTTPLGRVLNRFSRDMYIIDEAIPNSLRSFLFVFFSVISTVIVVIIATPIFAVMILPLGVFYVLVQVCTILGVTYDYAKSINSCAILTIYGTLYRFTHVHHVDN